MLIGKKKIVSRMIKKMIKNYTILLVICFTLLITATGCSKGSNNTEAPTTNTTAVRTGNSTESNSGVNPPTSPSIMPAPVVTPETAQVRLTEVETNADMIDSPLSDSKIMIKVGTTALKKRTDDNGVVLFDSVPCGNDVVITAAAEEGGEDGVFRRRLECKGTEVDLGVITRAFGGKYFLEQRRPQFMGYDAIKEVWLTADGKVISGKEIERIMSRYNSGSN
jgi:hypothetical protein